MDEELQEMLDLGIVEKSKSLLASPVVLVPKKDGTTWFFKDYRKFNDWTVTDTCPMPRIDKILDCVAEETFL